MKTNIFVSNFKKVSIIGLTAMFVMSGFLISNVCAGTVGYSPGDVLINEFKLDGTQWIELINTTNSNINLSSSTWKLTTTETGPGSGETVLSGIIPAKGLIVFTPNNLSTVLDTLLSLSYNGITIYAVSYGNSVFGVEPHLVGFPNVGQSAALINGSWSSTAPTIGWFNDAGQPDKAPLLSTIDANLYDGGNGIETNMGELINPSATPDTEAGGALYFEKTGKGRIVFEKTLNLSDQATVAVLQNLGTAMEMSAGHIEFDSTTATAMNATGAKIYFKSLSYTTQPNLIIKDDDNNVLNQDDVVPGAINYETDPTGACEVGAPVCMMMSFTAAHFLNLI